MIHITPVPAFQDNYIWCLCQPDSDLCLVVDPGDGTVIANYLQQHNKQLAAILVTHHHADHTGGLALLRQLWPSARIIGPAAEYQRIPLLTETVTGGAILSLPELQLDFTIIDVPGHTLGHIAFYAAPWLFCGDALFSAGCGRLFEGTAAQAYQSLSRLAALPDNTQVCCAHEYTLSNLAFCRTIEPENAELQSYQQHCIALRQQGLPTLPALLATEKKINPFLRCGLAALQQKWQQPDALSLFSWLRAGKDHFKS